MGDEKIFQRRSSLAFKKDFIFAKKLLDKFCNIGSRGDNQNESLVMGPKGPRPDCSAKILVV